MLLHETLFVLQWLFSSAFYVFSQFCYLLLTQLVQYYVSIRSECSKNFATISVLYLILILQNIGVFEIHKNLYFAALPGVLNWQRRLWYTMREFLQHRKSLNNLNTLNNMTFEEYERKLWESRNYITATTTYHFKFTQKISVGISRLQSLTNSLRVCIVLFFCFVCIISNIVKMFNSLT